jgi:hypothetical protein
MKTIKKILKYSLITILILFLLFMLVGDFLCPELLNKGFCDCSPSMPGPCPDNWDPMNECIKGHDCPD